MPADFREVLTRKLAEKQDQLGRTEDYIKRLAPPQDGTTGNTKGTLKRFQNRLGPPARSSEPLRHRLGPKVGEDEFGVEERAIVRGGVALGGGVAVQSRVVMEVKSRDEVLAEKKASENKNEAQRNRRMFGNLLGTLQRFRQDEKRVKDRELKKREIEKKIEEKSEKEKEEAKSKKRQLYVDRKKQQNELKILQLQMKRVEEFETWENSKRKEMQFIRSKTGPYAIYYLPKVHSDETLNLLEETMDLIENEIKESRSKFEEDLLKIEARMNDPHQDFEQEDEEEEEEEDFRPKSVIVNANNSQKIEDEEELRVLKGQEVKERSLNKDNNLSNKPNLRRHLSDDAIIKQETEGPKSKMRKIKQEHDESSGSGESSAEDETPIKVEIKNEKE